MPVTERSDLLPEFQDRPPSVMDDPRLAAMIFRSVTSGICIADATLPDMPVVYVNPAFEAMTGYSMDEMLGRNCRILQTSATEQTDQNDRAGIRHAIAERRESLTVLRNFRKDGTPFWNELYLSPIRDLSGEVTHFVGIQSDVTARVHFEAALRQSEKLAVAGRLASTIAHEINNPLESVMNLIYLAQRAQSSSETQQYLATADQELRRMKLITSQSLRFYKQSTQPREIDCASLLDTVLDLHAARLRNAGIVLERRDRSSRTLRCLESEIQQVLHHLISNAIDSMVTGSGRLLIRTRDATRWRTGEPGIVITVADTGSGIRPEAIKSIYTAFYTTKGAGGTGLGLWISSEIVARHHGRLRVRSAQPASSPGEAKRGGTVFELFLPLNGPKPKPGAPADDLPGGDAPARPGA